LIGQKQRLCADSQSNDWSILYPDNCQLTTDNISVIYHLPSVICSMILKQVQDDRLIFWSFPSWLDGGLSIVDGVLSAICREQCKMQNEKCRDGREIHYRGGPPKFAFFILHF
jgi:hypothetical protein